MKYDPARSHKNAPLMNESLIKWQARNVIRRSQSPTNYDTSSMRLVHRQVAHRRRLRETLDDIAFAAYIVFVGGLLLYVGWAIGLI